MRYVVYTFQFTPLVEVRQLDLFEQTLQVRDEIMAHKLEYFEEALASANIVIMVELMKTLFNCIMTAL